MLFWGSSMGPVWAFSGCILSQSDHPWQIYGVISSIQDGGHSVAILLQVLVFVSSVIWEGRNLTAHQISAKYLNPRLRYYYFRFLKTNVRNVGIVLPVPILTFASPSASAYQISHDPNWTIGDIEPFPFYPFFKMAATASQFGRSKIAVFCYPSCV